MSEAETILKMDGVTKIYGSGDASVIALDNVDFCGYGGEVVVVMGPSGAGKTTFLTIAGALLTPTSGTVEVSGVKLGGLSSGELAAVRRQKIGFIFQSFNLLESLTALENVKVVIAGEDTTRRSALNRARELLNMLGLSHRLKSVPKQLSGGEKQRVAIARALANNPSLLLADEPTANLDAKRGLEVMRLLRQIALELQKSVVIVSHDHRIREVAHRVLWLEDGRFRSDVITDRDPVCGQLVEVEAAPHMQFEGSVYHFCAEQCFKLFQVSPHLYARLKSQES